MSKKNQKTHVKSNLHPRNKHRERYNFAQLCASFQGLKPFVSKNKFGHESIDFFNPEAVKALNTALLYHFYHLDFWDIPTGYLCPPIPGRADYIHIAADLLEQDLGNKSNGSNIRCLDIGTGANCVYPIIGHQEYGWQFIGTDIDKKALAAAEKIVDSNFALRDKIVLRWQPEPTKIFKNILHKQERIELVLCNPPFHATAEEADAGTKRKLRGLTGEKPIQTTRNFAGQNNELWCVGGEKRFVQNMIFQSVHFQKNVLWFTTLVSKETNLPSAFQALKKAGAVEQKTINMSQGNKISRILAWTFLNEKERRNWK